MTSQTRAPLLVCILIIMCSTAWADSISLPFDGSAVYGNDEMSFSLGGVGVSLFSAAPHGPGDVLFTCGASCLIPEIDVEAIPSFIQFPIRTSAGSWTGITADSLLGDIDFSPSSDGTMTLTGRILGYQSRCVASDCTLGRLVFDLSLSGTGTATPLRPTDLGNGQTGYYQVGYRFLGMATDPPIVPEPGTWMLLGSGLLGLAGLKRARA